LYVILLIYRLSFPAEFQDAIKSSIPKLVEMTVNDEDERVRHDGLQSLKAVGRDGVLYWPLCFESDFFIFPQLRLEKPSS
jgi:hypothetical protein